MLSTSRTSYRIAHNGLVRAQMSALADGALNVAVLSLLDSRGDHRWRVDGTPYVVSVGGVPVTIRIRDELGKIDLNAADQDLLLGLFSSTGMSSAQSSAIVANILSWRSPNDLQSVGGVNDGDYRAASYPYHPRHGPFQSVDELKLVMGMTPALFQQIEPALTVYSKRALIKSQTAPSEVAKALSAMIGAAAATSLNETSEASFAGDGATLDPFIQLGGRAFTVTTELSAPEFYLRRETVIRLTEDTKKEYWVLAVRDRRHDSP